MNPAQPKLSESMQEKRSRNSLPRDGQEPDCGVEKEGERWVDLSLDASHRSLERGDGPGRQRREPVLLPSTPSSSSASTRSELGPIKSEPIFVERPIKPQENLIDCSSPIRETERGAAGPLSGFHSQCIRYRRSAVPFSSPHCHLLIDPVHMTLLEPQLTHPHYTSN